MFDLRHHAHRRFNPLRNEWVIVSPHRTRRPWQGTVDEVPAEPQAPYDPACYLCPGNARAGGARTPLYTTTFAFDNDFPALAPWDTAAEVRLKPDAPTERREVRLKPDAPTVGTEIRLKPDAPTEGISTGRPPSGGPDLSTGRPALAGPDLFIAEPERGVCRVVCFSPRHDLTLARMNVDAIRSVVDIWIDEYTALAKRPEIGYATIFENRGATMGASNPHPHCQIWATEHIPNEPARELGALADYRARRGSCLLCDYVALEMVSGERIICANDAFAALVPFWAVWPFETLVVSRRHVNDVPSLHDDERDGLAEILKQLTTRYDNLFEAPFPYSMGFHQQPMRGAAADTAHPHAHFYPPLLRSAAVRKFMVGFELLGSPQRDVTPEEAAARLQAASPVHYRDRAQAGAGR